MMYSKMKLLFFGYLASCFSIINAFDESELRERLLYNYDPLVRPSDVNNSPVNVTMEFRLLAVGGLDEKSQQLSTSVAFIMSWCDERLVWSVTGDKSAYLLLPAYLVWLPNLLITNSADLLLFPEGPKQMQVMVMNTGLIRVVRNLAIISSCSISVIHFPFDTHTCQIKILPALSYLSKTNVFAVKSLPHSPTFVENTEWRLDNFTFENNFVSSDLGNIDNTTQIDLIVTLTRRPLAYIANSIMPVACLSILNSMVFLLPAASGERIGLSVTILMAYAIYLTFIHESLPTNADRLCYFSMYIACITVTSSMIVILNIFSSLLHNAEDHRFITIICGQKKPKIRPDNELDRKELSKIEAQDDHCMYWKYVAKQYDIVCFFFCLIFSVFSLSLLLISILN